MTEGTWQMTVFICEMVSNLQSVEGSCNALFLVKDNLMGAELETMMLQVRRQLIKEKASKSQKESSM